MGDRRLETLSFDNTYGRLPAAFYAKLNPTPFASSPYLVSVNPAAADLIDLADAVNVDHADAAMHCELDRITCLARTVKDDSLRRNTEFNRQP